MHTHTHIKLQDNLDCLLRMRQPERHCNKKQIIHRSFSGPSVRKVSLATNTRQFRSVSLSRARVLLPLRRPARMVLSGNLLPSMYGPPLVWRPALYARVAVLCSIKTWHFMPELLLSENSLLVAMLLKRSLSAHPVCMLLDHFATKKTLKKTVPPEIKLPEPIVERVLF